MAKKFVIRAAIDEEAGTSVDFAMHNWTATATYYSDEYITAVIPSAGTLTVYGLVPGAGSSAEFYDGALDCADPSDYASAAAPLEAVSVIPSGITGATHYQITITGTE